MNLIRGTGSAGLCGIPSVRQVGEALILRPLLSLSQSDVLAAVAAEGIPYVTDSTNADTKYRRNYIRRELIPRILSVNPAFERSVGRMSESLREDVDFLRSEAQDRFCRIKRENGVLRDALLALHAAMRYRVVVLLYRQTYPNAPMPERVHIDALLRRLQEGGTFRLAFPGGVEAVAEGEILTFQRRAEDFLHPETPLSMGETVLADGARIFLLEKPVCPPYANVYKLSIHRDLASATINGGLYVRSRQEGDAYRFGGVTHKLKKLFSDAKIPLEERSHIPVVLDGEGILWVAGFGVRDDGARNGEEKDLTLYYLPRDAAAKIQRGDI